MEITNYDTDFTKEEVVTYYVQRELKLSGNTWQIIILAVLAIFVYVPSFIAFFASGLSFELVGYIIVLALIQAITILYIGKETRAAAMFHRILQQGKTVSDIVLYLHSIEEHDVIMEAAYILTHCNINRAYLTNGDRGGLIIQYTDGVSNLVFSCNTYKNLVSEKIGRECTLSVTRDGIILSNKVENKPSAI